MKKPALKTALTLAARWAFYVERQGCPAYNLQRIEATKLPPTQGVYAWFFGGGGHGGPRSAHQRPSFHGDSHQYLRN